MLNKKRLKAPVHPHIHKVLESVHTCIGVVLAMQFLNSQNKWGLEA
jgi:hypothetical protein